MQKNNINLFKNKFFRKDRSLLQNHQTMLTPRKIKMDNIHQDLDLTGSPLKDDCMVDAIADLSMDMKSPMKTPWKAEEECHKGVSVEQARTIMSSIDFQQLNSESAQNDQGSVWFLCDAADVQKTLLFQYEFNKGFNSRGLVNFMGIILASDLKVQPLLKMHADVMNPGAGSKLNLCIDSFIENVYNFNDKISIACAWNTSATVPSLNNLSNCDVKLYQTFRVKDCGMLTETFMNQLRILAHIRDDILAYKEASETSDGREAVYRGRYKLNYF